MPHPSELRADPRQDGNDAIEVRARIGTFLGLPPGLGVGLDNVRIVGFFGYIIVEAQPPNRLLPVDVGLGLKTFGRRPAVRHVQRMQMVHCIDHAPVDHVTV